MITAIAAGPVAVGIHAQGSEMLYSIIKFQSQNNMMMDKIARKLTCIVYLQRLWKLILAKNRILKAMKKLRSENKPPSLLLQEKLRCQRGMISFITIIHTARTKRRAVER